MSIKWNKKNREIMEKKITFDTGSKRNELGDVRYDLISPVGLRRLAETYAVGAAKYGDRNWELGQPFSVLINHVLDHINAYISEQRGILTLKGKELGEDHLAHAAWNLFALMHFQETMPALNDLIPDHISSVITIEEHPSKHYFHGDPKLLCQACKMDRDDPIHYQAIESGVPSTVRSTEGE